MSVLKRRIPTILLAVCLCFGSRLLNCACANAEERNEPQPLNTSAKPPKNEIDEPIPTVLPARLRKAFPPLPPDPVYEIEKKLRETDDETLTVAPTIPLRGEAPVAKTPEWRFPNEEVPVAQRSVIPSRLGDPETGRFSDDATDNDHLPSTVPLTTGTAVSPKAPALTKSADPEMGRFLDVPDATEKPAAPSVAKALASPVLKASTAPLKPLAPLPEETPRIETGSGLDKDDPTPAVAATPTQPVGSGKSLLDVQAAKEAVNSTHGGWNPSVNAPAEAVDPGHKWSAQDTLNDPKAKLAARPSGKAEDPEEKFMRLLAEIAEKRKHYGELLKAKNKEQPPLLNPQSGMVIRDHSEQKAYSTLTDAKRPMGGVLIKVLDAATKQVMCARVKLTDTTETVARAALPDGFWCRGVTPPIGVVSGLVRVEISHGGRFYPSFIKGIEVPPGQVLPMEVPMARSKEYDFAAQGWHLADLDIGIRKQPGENAVWFGPPPTANDLILGARCEGVRIVGVMLPLGDETAMAQVRAAIEKSNPDVLLIPVFPGPRNLFNGTGMGLGITNWEGLRATSAMPEIPLREGFEAIRQSGGLAVYKDIKGTRTASIEDEILPLYRRLKNTNYFTHNSGRRAHMYSAAELPYDTVTGSYDVLAFDGSDAMESVWFNLLNEGVPVRAIGAGGGSLEGGRIPFGQTMLQIDGTPTREKVLDAIQTGRTMISYGPAVFCKVFERDMGPGSVLPTDGRRMSLQIQAYSSAIAGAEIDKVEIIRNGVVVFSQNAAEGQSIIRDMRWPLSESANSWYVVRVTERIGHRGMRSEQTRRAWTSPIYFRSAAFEPPSPCVTRVHGTLRKGLTPIRGVVTALATGMPTRRVESGPDGSFEISLPSTGTLVFEAPECEPSAKRIFEHPKVQSAMGKFMTSDDLQGKLAERAVFGLFRLTLSDLEWDATLIPCAAPPEPRRLPEP